MTDHFFNFTSSEERQSFPRGGLVTGPGTRTSDDVPSRIPAGSYVLNADAVEIAGVETLETINAMALVIEGNVELSDGEFVVLPAAVAAFGKDFFDRINAAGLLQRAGVLGEPARIMAYAACLNAMKAALGGCVVTPAQMPTMVDGDTKSNGLAGGGMLGIAMGAGAETYNKLQQQNEQDKRADADLQMRQQSIAQQLALGTLKVKEAESRNSDNDAVRAHINKTRADLSAISAGDYSPLTAKADLYSKQTPGFDNGYTAKINGDVFEHYNQKGELENSIKLDQKTARQLYLTAADMEMAYISPSHYEAARAAESARREKELDRKNKTDVAGIYADSRTYNADARSDASMYGADRRAEASQYSADHRPAARNGGVTSTQERSNLEIDAARRSVSDLSPEDIRQRTAKTTNTGRENPLFDPGLERASRLASRRKIGADDWFDQRYGGNAAEPAVRNDIRSSISTGADITHSLTHNTCSIN